MFKKLLINLLSSWAVNPLGVMLVQANGLGSNESLKLYFLITGASIPFQLLLSESYAATGRKKLSDKRVLRFLALIMAVQFAVAAYASVATGHSLLLSLIFCVGSSLWLLISFLTANQYYEKSKVGVVRDVDSFMIGVLPGLVSVFLYFVFVVILKHDWLPLAAVMLFVFPSFAQYLLVRGLKVGESMPVDAPDDIGSQRSHVSVAMILIIAFLWLCSGEAVRLKLSVAEYFPQYSVLFVYATNLLITLVDIFLKASHLNGKFGSGRNGIGQLWGLLFLAVTTLLTFSGSYKFSEVVQLLAAQCSIIILLDIGRKRMAEVMGK